MTPSEKTVLRAAEFYLTVNSGSPSVRDLGLLTGLSKSWVHTIVVRLWNLGLVSYRPGRRRSIVLTEQGCNLIGSKCDGR
jgi:DNA-binding MarR family transcriptional regulator